LSVFSVIIDRPYPCATSPQLEKNTNASAPVQMSNINLGRP
jgi:hypothetical protein